MKNLMEVLMVTRNEGCVRMTSPEVSHKWMKCKASETEDEGSVLEHMTEPELSKATQQFAIDDTPLAARYGVEETGLMVHVVNDAEEAIGKLQNVNYEMLICDLALEADDAQRVMAVAQHQLPDTVRLSLDTTNVPATTEMIRQTARRLVQAQESKRITVTDGIPGAACSCREKK